MIKKSFRSKNVNFGKNKFFFLDVFLSTFFEMEYNLKIIIY